MPISSIAKTEAITLRVSPFSNTSHVVTWLTPDYGKIATVIKGACRPKSLASGQYDIGFLCELLFYQRDHNGLHAFRECTSLDSRPDCRASWHLTTAMGYLCHLATIATPDGGHAPDLYQLLESSIGTLSRDMAPSSIFLLLSWFELQLLTILGIPPQLDRCVTCRKPVTAGRPGVFSTRHGGIICHGCSRNADVPQSADAISGDVAAILRRLQSNDDFAALRTLRCTGPQQLRLKRLLGDFLLYYIDLAPECRAVPYQMLNAAA
jgi:DNA repair protein RecO (recombination protein O)